MKSPPRSKQFDDVYFSAQDGLAETQHVFIDSNNLPEAWGNKEHFTITETGFGTGLNFLSIWKCFDKSAKIGQNLHFISIEKFPLASNEILDALSHWSDFFEGRLEIMAEKYPQRLPGFHRIIITENITLTLIFDDIADALPRLTAPVDAWFLDGFKPSSNPEMWSEKLYSNMARLSHEGTSYATFTSAGHVRRGLAAAGFSVKKVPGFGRKREMIVGKF